MKLHVNTLPLGAPRPHTTGILLETILKNNNLSFMDRHFLQLVSTARGTTAALPYTNLFTCCHEETMQEGFIWTIPFWKRFTDYIFLIFLGQEVSFLDMKIHLGADHKPSTGLYRKPTDCATLLHFDSNHSLKCKESTVFFTSP